MRADVSPFGDMNMPEDEIQKPKKNYGEDAQEPEKNSGEDAEEYDAAAALADLKARIAELEKETAKLRKENGDYLRQIVRQTEGKKAEDEPSFEDFKKETVKKVFDIIEARS